jgi:hypothetical protein
VARNRSSQPGSSPAAAAASGGLGPRLLGALPARIVIAAGLLNTSVQVGSSLGLGALAAIAAMVTRSRLAGHPVAAALTDGYVAGLLAGAVLFAAGAVVAICTVNARISPAEAAAR